MMAVNGDPFDPEPSTNWVPTLAMLVIAPPVMLLAPFVIVFSAISKAFSQWWAKALVHNVGMPILHAVMAEPFGRVMSSKCKGRVLDLGCGVLPHSKHYQTIDAVTEVVALEPNPQCHAALRAKAAAAKDYTITISSTPIAEEQSASFDTVVLSFVMCEHPNYEQLPMEAMRVLKLGGCVIFQEHIGSEKGTFMRKFQNAVQPAWYLLSDGCHCNREQKRCMEAQPWEATFSRIYDFPILARMTLFPHIPKVYMGVAIKGVAS